MHGVPDFGGRHGPGAPPVWAQQGVRRPRPFWCSQPEMLPIAGQREFTGRIEAKDKVDLRARVEGFLEQRLFEEGDGQGRPAAVRDREGALPGRDRDVERAPSPAPGHAGPARSSGGGRPSWYKAGTRRRGSRRGAAEQAKGADLRQQANLTSAASSISATPTSRRRSPAGSAAPTSRSAISSGRRAARWPPS